MTTKRTDLAAVTMAVALLAARAGLARTYGVVDTGQVHCFSSSGQLRTLPRPGRPFCGQAAGFMPDPRTGRRHKMNVHGAGSQRSDPKSGDPRAPEWAQGHGPQGDETRILNYARAVRNIDPQSVRLVQPDTDPLRVSPVRGGDRHPPGSGPGLGPAPHEGNRPPPGRRMGPAKWRP